MRPGAGLGRWPWHIQPGPGCWWEAADSYFCRKRNQIGSDLVLVGGDDHARSPPAGPGLMAMAAGDKVQGESLAAADEAREFEAQLELVSGRALRLASRLRSDPDEAADLLSEALFRAWKYRAGRSGPFGPWFMSILCRLARGGRNRWPQLPSWEQGSVTAPGRLGIDLDLKGALEQLPARQRTAIWLRYGEDLSLEQVASALEMTPGAASQLLFRGRQNLRRRLPARGR